ncbi:MAG: hypothetical protein JNK57_05730 [Planctomycetaceae bacterium]|nr:hypothetical protein [Planctomycetaceae bacterium]
MSRERREPNRLSLTVPTVSFTTFDTRGPNRLSLTVPTVSFTTFVTRGLNRLSLTVPTVSFATVVAWAESIVADRSYGQFCNICHAGRSRRDGHQVGAE